MSKKRLLALVLSVALILSLGALSTSAADITEVNPLDMHSNEFYVNQSNSIETYNELLTAMRAEANSYSPSSLSSTSTATYPDYYGGAYIDEQTGQLTVLLTETGAVVEDEIARLSGATTGILFQECDISYNDITETVDTLSENIAYFEELGIFIDGISDDILNGKVIVLVQDLNADKENVIKEFVGCDYLYFQNSTGAFPDEAFGGGDSITSLNNNGTSTICCAAERNNQDGFVIAGHAGDIQNEKFKSGSTTIGSVTATAYYNNSTADAAFVRANSGVTPTSIMKNGGDMWAASAYELPVNTTVWKYGHSTQLTSGQITGTNATVVYENENTHVRYTIKECWTANYASDGGDSGAPVMTFDGNYGSSSKYTLYGIHSGASNSSSTRYLSPYGNIVDELGITCITN